MTGLLAATLALAIGAAAIRPSPAQEAAPPPGAPPPVAPGSAYSPAGLARAGAEMDLGKRVYERYCIGCHGVNGDGNGEAARFLDPKPRDFRRGLFKFVSVEAGKLPRDDDLMKTITRGLRGTSMPSFRFVSEEERRAVVGYLKTFAPRRWTEQTPGAVVARGQNPYDPSLDTPKPVAEALERGRALYHSFGCQGCHPAFVTQGDLDALSGGKLKLRKDADRPRQIEDSWGNWIEAPDFTRRTLRASHSLDEIFTTITAGVGGAAMPTMATALTDEQRWQLAHYVRSLAEKRGTIAGPSPRPVRDASE